MQCESKESSPCSSTFYISIQEEELSKLLDSWNFGYMLDKLQSEAVTVERLRFLTEADLDQLFQTKKIGEKAEFRFRLLEWKKQKGFCDNVSLNTNVSNSSMNFNLDESENPISSGNFDLQSILKEHPTGDYVIRTFSENGKLDDTARKILVDAIITWAIKRKSKLTKNYFEKISSQIEKDFCEDKEVYFRKVGFRSSGRLFDKYYNTLKRLKKNGEWTCSNNNNNSVNLLENNSPQLDCNEEAEVRKAHEWLKVFTEPWSEVTKNWRICYFKRKNDINQAVDGNNIICVLDNWKLFSHSLGYTLQ